jgi:hypothetical protein
MKLVPAYPCRRLDGAPMRACDHQHQTTDPAELAIIEAIGKGIIKAGIPKPLAHAGDVVETTWGCGGNKHLKTRKATIYRVEVALVRHPQSMFHRPQLFYYGKDAKSQGMVLMDFVKGAVKWEMPKGDRMPVTFALEWLHDETGEVQRVPGNGVHFIRETTPVIGRSDSTNDQ